MQQAGDSALCLAGTSGREMRCPSQLAPDTTWVYDPRLGHPLLSHTFSKAGQLGQLLLLVTVHMQPSS